MTPPDSLENGLKAIGGERSENDPQVSEVPLLRRKGGRAKNHGGLSVGRNLVAIIKNVPAGVCEVCGEQYFKAQIVKAMEREARSKTKPKDMQTIPVRELKVA